MKSDEVISHIFSLPSYARLAAMNEATNALKSLLGKTRGALVAFAYERGERLFVALTHPAGLQEFRHDDSIFTIKTLLKTYVKAKIASGEETRLVAPSEVRFFIAKERGERGDFVYEPRIDERARGEFANLASEGEIRELFEEIRAIVRAKNGSNLDDARAKNHSNLNGDGKTC